MLMNFALDVLGTAVTCDRVSTDGHECTNLTSADFMTKKRGYLAEHFVKPPVHITFTFPCNVNISYIVVDPFVGQQQSKQLNLLFATKPVARTSHGKFRQQMKYQNSHQLPSSNESQLPAFHQVSSITNTGRSRVCFYNYRSCQRLSDMSYMEYPTKSEIRHSKGDLLTSTSHIMVKIARTEYSLTPALSNIEIWASVSSSVCDGVRKLVEDKYNCFITPAIIASPKLTPKQTVTVTRENSCINTRNEDNVCDQSEKNDSDSEIPEDFLDPLTCEVMTIPMLLPCGKNIDQSSLDRFLDSEASHGRRPRDPFTGVEFSPVVKPIPNVDLKARIDSFLVFSSITSTATIPRTVRMGESSRLLGKRKRDERSKCVSSLVTGFDYKNPVICDRIKNVSGKINLKSSPELSTPSIAIVEPSSSSFNTNDTTSHNSKLNCQPYPQGHETSKSHDDRLKDSLDHALSSVLANIHSTIKSTDKVRVSSDCSKCGLILKPDQVGYATPCSHHFCRDCLLSLKDQEIDCPKCGEHFKRVDVVRSHKVAS